MTTEVDYYELLEVERTADGATIKSAYRKMAMKYHPDKTGGCADSEAKFKSVSEAYECLKDPQKRAAYDRYGHAAYTNAQSGGGGGAGGFRGGAAGGFSDLGDIFETIFGQSGFGGAGGGRCVSRQARRARLSSNIVRPSDLCTWKPVMAAAAVSPSSRARVIHQPRPRLARMAVAISQCRLIATAL